MAVVVTINAVDRTAYVQLQNGKIEKQANRLNGIFTFHFLDESRLTGATPIALRERQEVIVTDGGVKVFGGQIATLKPKINGLSIDYLVKCQSFDSLLDHRVIETLVRSGSRSDASDVQAIAAYHSALESATFVSTTETVTWDIDYSGLSLRQALDKLSREVGGTTYWVDDDKKIHWGDPLATQKILNTGWDIDAASWALDGSAVRTADVGPGGTGDYALITTGNGSGRHESTQTVSGIIAAKRYFFFVDMWQSVADKAAVRLDWQNSGSVSQRIDTIDGTGMGTSAWFRKKAVLIAPATATKVVVMLGGANNFTGTVRHDNMALAQETAGWGVHTTPDGTTTHSVIGFQRATDATKPINRLLCRGDGITEWREFASSIAYYGAKFEGILNDGDMATAADIDQKALTVFRKYAFPRLGATYETTYAGLDAGTWQIVEHEVLGLQSIEWIAKLDTTFLGNNNAVYEVTLGEPEDDLGAMIAALSGSFQPGSDVDLPPPPGTDTVAPAVPTGLDLTTGQTMAPDGTFRPYLLGTWNAVADIDLDAYEFQFDRAIDGDVTFSVSASGTGGSLAAGDYRVRITGQGLVGGETHTDDVILQTVNAGQRLFVNITAKPGITTYKVYASRHDDPKSNAQTTTTTGSNVEITSEGAGAVAPTSSTAVSFLTPTTFRSRPTSSYTEDVLANWYYAGRVRAIDDSGNASAFTAIDSVVVAKDTTAPAIPTGLTAISGYRLVGLRWARNTESDLFAYEVRYAPESTPGSGVPDTAQWTTVRPDSTACIIDGLDPGTAGGVLIKYFFQVRAIDRSGNVRTSAGDPTAVVASDSPEAGWSNITPDWVIASPQYIGAADVAFNSVITNILSTNHLDAATITTGTFSVGGPGSPPVIVVYNVTGQEIGRWDLNGLVIKDPNNTGRQMRFVNGVLQFTSDNGANWTTAISADGIIADEINLGTSPGGHNNIPNSGFELAAYGQLAPVTWTTSAGAPVGWDDAEMNINANIGGTELVLNSAAY